MMVLQALQNLQKENDENKINEERGRELRINLETDLQSIENAFAVISKKQIVSFVIQSKKYYEEILSSQKEIVACNQEKFNMERVYGT
jgi:hypothetical protein